MNIYLDFISSCFEADVFSHLLLHYILIDCVVLSMLRKSDYKKICSWKWRSIFIAFLDNYEYSLILLQNSSSGNFLKVSCNVKLKSTKIHFSYSVTLKPIWTFIHAWFVMWSTGHLETISSLNYADPQMLTDFVM